MRKIFTLLALITVLFTNSWAQDDCATAVALTVTQPNQNCSSILYDNTAATASGTDPIPACWSPATVSHTMWFTFVPDSNQVHISTNFTQTLGNTQIAVFSGSCGSLTQIACQEDASFSGGLFNNDIVVAGLTIGNTYYIMVDGNANMTGTFGVCVENIPTAAPPSPTQDCIGAVYLCNTGNPPAITDGPGNSGNVTTEIPSCFFDGSERASWWYQFTVATGTTLCFTIDPNTAIDYDFAVYDVTSGCATKSEVACNWQASSGNGNTGLGCTGGGTGCAACITVTPGNTYAIHVSRYTTTSTSGFSLLFDFTNGLTFTAPNANFTTPATVCASVPVTLTNTSSGSNNSYIWNFGTGATSTLANPSYAFPSAGTYNVSLLLTNPYGCTDYITKTVTVVNGPIAPVATSKTICKGTPTQLNASGSGPTYLWYNVPTGGAPLAMGVNYNVPAAAYNNVGTYTFYVGSYNGTCYGPRTPVTLTVVDAPAVPTAGSNSPICVGSTLNLTATTVAGANYAWTGPNGFTSTSQNPNIPSATAAAGGTYNVVAIIGTCTSAVGSVAVSVNSSIPAPTVSGATICSNNTATLTVTAPASGQFDWYDAAAGGTLVQGNSSTFTTPTLTATTTYYVESVQTGCTSARTAVVVTVNSIPSTPTAGSNSPLCAGSTINLTATNVAGATYFWTGPNSFTSTSQNPNISSATTAMSGTYNVVAIISGCTSLAGTVNVTVNAIPAAPTASGATICPNNSATLTASGTPTFAWYTVASGGSPTFTGASFTTPTLSATTTYYVESIVSGCTSARTAVVVTVNAAPAAPTASNVSICSGNTASLTASGGGTLTWYTVSSGGSNIGTGSPFVTPALFANTTYYVESVQTGCTSARTAVLVTVNAIPSTPTAGSNSPLCAGSTINLTATNVAGANYAWTGPNGFTSTSQNPSIASSTTAMSGTYNVVAIISGCTSSAGTVNVTVNAIPSAPSASSNSPLCAGATINLTATNVVGANYAWTGPNGFTSTSQNPSIASSTTSMSGTYNVVAIISGCTSSAGTVNVTVNPTPTAPTVANQTICEGQTATLTVTAPASGTFQWYNVPIGGTPIFTGSTFTTPALSSTLTGYVETVALGCTSARTTVTVTVTPTPTTPTASSNSPLCAGSTINLSATNVAGANYAWTGPNGFTSTSQNPSISSATTAMSGTYNVVAIISGCTSLAGTVNVTVNSIPSAPTAGSNSPLCAGSTINLTATNVAGATYSWTGPNGFTSTTQNPTIASATTAMSGTYNVVAIISGCTSLAGTVNVTVNAIPSAPTAGSNSPLCAGTTINLTATNVAGANYAWTGPNGFTSTTQNPSIASATTAMSGTYNVVAIISGCTSSVGTVNVTVNSIPSAPTAGSNSPLCAGSTINLTATNVAGATYSWTGPNGFTSTTQNPTIASATTAMSGTYNVVAIISGCTSSAGTVNVIVNAIPSAPTASSNSPLCTGSTINLTATNVAGANYAWTGPNGFASTAQNPSIASATTAMSGTYNVVAIISGCTSSAGTVNVTINAIPAVPTVTGATICPNNTATLSASGSGTLDWYDTATGGTLLQANATTFTTPILTATTNYFVENIQSGCTSARVQVTATVNASPSAPTATGGTICSGNTFTINAVAGGTMDWYDAATGGTLLQANSTSYTTPTLLATTTYYVESVQTGCTSARTAVVVNVTPLPTAPTASGTTICENSSTTITATAPTSAQFDWYDAASGGTLLQANSASFTTPTLSTTTTYYVESVQTGCTSARTAVVVTVTPLPTAPTASGTTICENSTATITATAPASAQFDWYDAVTGGTLVQGNSASFTTPTLSATTTYYVESIANGCTSASRTAVVVTVTPLPVAPSASSNSPLCAGSTINLTATSVTGATYSWTGPNGFTSTTQNPSISSATTAMSGTYNVVAIISGCTSSAGTVNVTVNAIPSAPTAGSNSPLCAGSTINLTATNVAGANYAWTGPNGFASTAQNPSIASATTVMAGTYNVVAIISGCTSSAGTVNVTINAIPAVPTVTGATICPNNTATLSASGSGTLDWYDAASGGTLLQTNATTFTTPILTATTNYFVENIQNVCTSARVQVTATVNASPSAPTATGGTICSGNTFTINAVAGGTMDWYDAATGGTLLQANSTSYTTPTLSATTTYYVESVQTGCTSARTAVVVNVTPLPAAPTASGTTICENSTATITATAPASAQFDWYDAVTGGTLLQGNSASFTTPTLSATTTYYVEAIANGCTSASRTAVVVTVTPLPVAPTASGTTICENSTATITATAPASAQFDWYDSATGGTLLQGNSASFTTPTLSATTTYYVEAIANGCTSASRTAVVVTVTPLPSAPTASGTTICENSTTTITATAPASAQFDWYDAVTGGTLVQGNSASFTTPTLSATTTYYVEAIANGCTSASRTAVVVTVTPLPSAPTASGTTICENSTSTITATAPASAQFDWYDSATGGTLVQGNSASFTTPTLSATTTYYVEAIANGCTSATRTAVVVTVTPLPVAPIASGTTICENSTATITATAPASAQFDWYDAATSGTLLQANSTTYTTPTLSTTTTYYVESIQTGCTSARTAVVVNVTPLPTAPTASGTTICENSTATITATAPASAQFDWYDSATGGTLVQGNSASFTTPTLSATTTYYVESIANGCTSATRTAVVVTVTPLPSAPTASGTTICENSSTTITATAPASAQFDWYDSATGGTLVQANSASFTTPTLSATTTYYVESIANGCTSATRTAVVVTVTPLPAAPTASGTTICENSTATITATAPIGAQFDWYDSATGGTLVQGNSASFTTPTLSATTTYYVEAIANGCTSATRTAVVVTVTPLPAAPTASGTTICENSTATITATAPASAQFDWYDSATSGTLVQGNSASFTTPTLSSTTTYYVESVMGSCTSSTRTAVTVTVNPIPDAGANDTICLAGQGAVIPPFNVSPANLPGGVWSGQGIVDAVNGTFDHTQTPGWGTYTLTYTLNGCSDTKQVVVNGSKAGIPVSICVTETNFTPATAQPANGTWSGVGVIDTTTGQVDVSQLSLGQNILSYTSNGCTDILTVTVVDTVHANFTSNPITPTELFIGQSTVTFTNTSNTGNLFVWNFGDGSTDTTHAITESTSHTYSQEGSYVVTLTAYNELGCATTHESGTIVIRSEFAVVPNVITPNGDGVNDIFRVTDEGVVTENMQIFDRWGVSIYNSNNENPAWDGTKNGSPAPEGVYTYIVTLRKTTGIKRARSGVVTLVR